MNEVDEANELLGRAGADRLDKMTADDSVGMLDEVTLIEERRKRREAIKAKHRGQASPLLMQTVAPEKSNFLSGQSLVSSIKQTDRKGESTMQMQY